MLSKSQEKVLTNALKKAEVFDKMNDGLLNLIFQKQSEADALAEMNNLSDQYKGEIGGLLKKAQQYATVEFSDLDVRRNEKRKEFEDTFKAENGGVLSDEDKAHAASLVKEFETTGLI